MVATKKRKYSPQECDTKNKSFPVTCLFIFLSYILLYSPQGVMKVGMRVLVVFVTFLNTFNLNR